MHERLKFKIQLNDQRGVDPDWGLQPIFTESQYGSHYVINARFEGKEIDKDKGTVELSKIHFYIQNYTGSVTVGLEKYAIIEECNPAEKRYGELLEPEYPDSKIYKIQLFARGFSNNFDYTHDIQEHLKVINRGDIIVTEVVYLPVTKLLTHYDQENMFQKAAYVDPLYMERDGEDVDLTKVGRVMIKKMTRLGVTEDDNGVIDFNAIKSFDTTDGAGGSRECKASVSMGI